MPLFVHEDLFKPSDQPTLYLACGNGQITGRGQDPPFKDYRVAMDAGLAREMRDRVPGIDTKLGGLIAEYGDMADTETRDRIPTRVLAYGMVQSEDLTTGHKHGLFQTRYKPSGPPSLSLIGFPVVRLNLFLLRFPSAVRLEFPEQGPEGLPRSWVQRVLDDLPDCVTVCEK